MKKIYELNSKGLVQSYFDLEMIKLLLCFDNKNSIKNNIYDKLNDIINEINDSFNEFNKKNDCLFEVNNSMIETVKRYLFDKKDFIIRGVSALLTTSIIIGGAIGIHKGIKKFNTNDSYKKIITTYSDWNGLNTSEEFVKVKNANDVDGKKYLKVYDVWEKVEDHYSRKVKIYDISNYQFDNIEDYINYGIDNYGVDYYTDTETNYNVSSIQFYTDEYVEVETTVVDTSKVETLFSKGGYTAGLIASYIGYLICWIIFFVGCWEFDNLIWSSFVELFDYYMDFNESKNLNEQKIKELKCKINELLVIINNNEKLKGEFNRLFEENKYLLDDPKELYKRFNYLVIKLDNIDINYLKCSENKRLVKKK